MAAFTCNSVFKSFCTLQTTKHFPVHVTNIVIFSFNSKKNFAELKNKANRTPCRWQHRTGAHKAISMIIYWHYEGDILIHSRRTVTEITAANRPGEHIGKPGDSGLLSCKACTSDDNNLNADYSSLCAALRTAYRFEIFVIMISFRFSLSRSRTAETCVSVFSFAAPTWKLTRGNNSFITRTSAS